LIFIISKNYIFKRNLNEQMLNIVEFKHTIMWYRSLEQYNYIKEKQYLFSIWKNEDPFTINFPLSIIFFLLSHISIRFFCQFFYQVQNVGSNLIFLKNKIVRECVWWMKVFITIIYYTYALLISTCKLNIVTKFIVFENLCHTLDRWCKGITKSWLWTNK
jgi:hypothetical protein